MTKMFVVVGLLAAAPAWAQTPPAAPAAGSGGGGPVGASQSTPTSPMGATPPGTPSTGTVNGQLARDGTGQAVIGQTATPPSAVPGNTGGAGTGAVPPAGARRP